MGLCRGSAPFSFQSDACCLPRAPTDPRWLKAWPGLEPLLAEVPGQAEVAGKGCFNCGPDYRKTKEVLDR